MTVGVAAGYILFLFSVQNSDEGQGILVVTEHESSKLPQGIALLISYFADGKVEVQRVKWIDRSDGQKAAEPELKPSAWTPSSGFFQ